MLNDNRTTVLAKVRQYWAECVLAAIVLLACLLSVIWVFRVPILQNPDESSHIDYAFSIYSAGRLLNVRTPPSAYNVHPRFEGRKELVGPESLPYEMLSHQYTLYLIDTTDFQRIRFHSDQRVSSDYGTLKYYQRLDANAPKSPAQPSDPQRTDNPWMLTAYPFLYYAAVAIFQRLLSVFNNGPVFLFFAARLLSTVFFGASLLITYAVLRELRLSKARSLMITAIVAFFPLSIFIASAVQPDNLTILLVVLCWYLALRIRHSEEPSKLCLLLGIGLGALLVTKYHFFLFTAVGVFVMLISEHVYRRLPLSKLIRPLSYLVVPSLLFFIVQLWVVWGSGTITGSNLHPASVTLVAGVKNAILDYYRGGPALVSWWGIFGWMDAPLVIWSPGVQVRVLQLVSLLSLLVLVLIFFRLEQVVTRLVVLAKSGRWRTALRLTFSNPLIISHQLFSVFMVLLYALTDNTFYAQGRHWFPYTLSGLLITTQFAPRALTHRKVQRAVSILLLSGLLVYCAVGAYFSLKAITTRYYGELTSSVRL